MPTPPLSPYSLSSVVDSNLKLGNDGSLYSTNYLLTITQWNTDFSVVLKPFFSQLKYSFSKELEYVSDKDKWSKVVKEYTGDVSIDIDVSLPSSTPEEARNNLAKIEHLQKMILEPYGEAGSWDIKPAGPIFSVTLSNLIFGTKISKAKNDGFICFIKSVNYTPETDMGFFEFDEAGKNYFFPKLIKLQLKLELDNNNLAKYLQAIRGYQRNGKLIEGDSGAFPFDAPDCTLAQAANIISSKYIYKTTTFIFFSRNDIGVIFPSFIDAFSRNFDVDNNVIESKSKYVGKGVDTGKYTTPSKLSYQLGFSVPCNNIEESKIFAKEINKLVRMFYRPKETDERVDRDPFKVYVPGFIEKAGDPSSFSIPTSEKTKDANGVWLWMEDLGIEIEESMGFFEESTHLWPKAYKITTSLVSDYSHRYENSLVYPFKKKEDGNIINEVDNFPFNRKTFKIGQ